MPNDAQWQLDTRQTGDVMDLAHDLSGRGVKRHVIQAFGAWGCENSALLHDTRREGPLADLVENVAELFDPGD